MRQIKISQSITNRDSDGLEKYLTEISREDLISPEEEVRLSQEINKGCTASLEKLAKANLRFVVSVAKQYQNQGVSLSDLINEGNIGLIKACYKFDPSKGFKFISYAVWWIRQSILQAISDQSRLVRLPVNKVNLNTKVRKAAAELEQKFEREPSPHEIAQVIDVDVADIEMILKYNSRHVSMDAPAGNDEDAATMGEILNINHSEYADNKMAYVQSLNKEIERHLSTLPSRHKEILCSYYGIGNQPELSLEELSEKYGLTRERVRQIKDTAIAKLRAKGNNNILRSYL